MRHKLARALIALLLISLIGGHWFVLQSVAWVGMFAKFSQTGSFTVALVKTFDGKNSCRLCLAVKEGKKTEQKQNPIKVETKFEIFVWNAADESRVDSWTPTRFPILSELAAARHQKPPLPPPRFV